MKGNKFLVLQKGTEKDLRTFVYGLQTSIGTVNIGTEELFTKIKILC